MIPILIMLMFNPIEIPMGTPQSSPVVGITKSSIPSLINRSPSFFGLVRKEKAEPTLTGVNRFEPGKEHGRNKVNPVNLFRIPHLPTQLSLPKIEKQTIPDYSIVESAI